MQFSSQQSDSFTSRISHMSRGIHNTIHHITVSQKKVRLRLMRQFEKFVNVKILFIKMTFHDANLISAR